MRTTTIPKLAWCKHHFKRRLKDCVTLNDRWKDNYNWIRKFNNQNSPFSTIDGKGFGTGLCYDLNVCIFPKFVCWSPIPNVMVLVAGAFGRWLGPEGGTLMNGISALIEGAQESSLSPSTMWGYNEKSSTRNGVLTWPCWHPDLRLPDFRTVINKFVFFFFFIMSVVFVIAVPTD